MDLEKNHLDSEELEETGVFIFSYILIQGQLTEFPI